MKKREIINLGYIDEDDYAALLEHIKDNKGNYAHDISWIKKFLGKSDYFHKSNIATGSFCLSTSGPEVKGDKNNEDFKNCKAVHEALRGRLTPYQAVNPYLWTGLSHFSNECYEYTKARWGCSPNENTIKTRFFVTNTDSLFDHAIARLYLIGEATYDKDNPSNPYHITEIIFLNQRFIHDMFTSQHKYNFDRIKGSMLAIKRIMDEYGDAGSTQLLRDYNKHMNMIGASKNLNIFSWQEIEKMAYDFMKEYMENKIALRKGNNG